jgi:hypothetical protein
MITNYPLVFFFYFSFQFLPNSSFLLLFSSSYTVVGGTGEGKRWREEMGAGRKERGRGEVREEAIYPLVFVMG